MPTKLRVRFGGLCLFIYDQPNKQVGVVMPDARKLKFTSTGPLAASNPHHPDNTKGEPHVGYVRLNLANLADFQSLPPGNEIAGPKYEVVHRVAENQLTLEFKPADSTDIVFSQVPLPEFDVFARGLSPASDMFTPSPQTPVLFRTQLLGGAVVAEGLTRQWKIPAALRGTGDYQQAFAGTVKWERDIADGEAVTLRFSTIAEPAKTTEAFVLKPIPVNGVNMINIDIANLCANPLEWIELPSEVTNEDRDFKWLYRLLMPPQGTKYEQLLFGAELPFPRAAQAASAGDQSCTGGQVKGTFTFIPATPA